MRFIVRIKGNKMSVMLRVRVEDRVTSKIRGRFRVRLENF